jgi:hypothetical protein
MNHTPSHSLTNSSESEVEASNSSPDFPKFRPGLLSEHRSDTDTSPDFPKFRPGLLAQQSSEAVNPSPDVPKFRSDLQNPNSDTKTTSPDFPKFRPGLLSQQNQDQVSTSISPDAPNFRPNLTDQENVSPDFPKFRPGLLNEHPSAPFFKLQSPPAGHQKSPDLYSKPTAPARPVSPPGYVTQHLKCPVSPLARTSAQARFPQIRSILKAPSAAGHALVNQQSKPMGSPLMRRVLQHNLKTLANMKLKGASSPTSPPYNIYTQTMVTNYTTEIPDVLQNSRSHDHTIPHSMPESVNDAIMQSPVTSPTEREIKMNTSPPPHVHFAGTAIKETLNEEIEDGDTTDITSPLLAGPEIFCIAPTPPINQAEVSSREATPGPLCHQDDRPKPSVSVSPKISMRYSRRKSVTFEGEVIHTGPLRSHHSRKSPLSPISSRYHKRRRSISTIGHKQKSEHHMLTPSPHLPSHVYRKVSLSPIHSRPFKINNKEPLLNQTQHIKVPSPHLPTHVYRNVSLSPINYKRRRSISILPHHHASQNGSFPVSTRHNKRRKSVSIFMAQGESGHGRKITSPRHHHKRRKSVSIVNGTENNHPSVLSVNPRQHIRRKSLAVVPHYESYQNGGFPTNSRHYKRRRSESIMSQYQHDKHVIPSPRLPVHVYRKISLSPKYTSRIHEHPESNIQGQDDIDNLSPPVTSINAPMSPINYKRRRSIVSVGQEKTSEHRPLTPKSPGRFFRKHLPSPFIFGRRNRRKSVLVINRDDRLIPLTSPMFNRITHGAYERSLPSTPIPRRFARRKSLSVITPRTRRRVETDEQLQVTMEAARFDVTSIYSSKSFLSLAPAAISREKPGLKTKKHKVGC